MGHNRIRLIGHDRKMAEEIGEHLCCYSLAGPELPTIAEGDRGGTPW
jgi:hypothetical protein